VAGHIEARALIHCANASPTLCCTAASALASTWSSRSYSSNVRLPFHLRLCFAKIYFDVGHTWPVLLSTSLGHGMAYADCDHSFNLARVPGKRIPASSHKPHHPPRQPSHQPRASTSHKTVPCHSKFTTNRCCRKSRTRLAPKRSAEPSVRRQCLQQRT